MLGWIVSDVPRALRGLQSTGNRRFPTTRGIFVGPKLLNELSETAKRFVMSKRPGWVSHSGGVQTLLNHLRQHLGLPQLAEMSDFLAKYFKQSRRKKSESNERVHHPESRVVWASWVHTEPRPGTLPAKDFQRNVPWCLLYKWTTSFWGHPGRSRSPEVLNPDGAPSSGEGAEDPGETEDARSQTSWSGWQDWNYRRWEEEDWDYWSWNRSQDYEGSATWSTPTVKLLPEFVQGWLLLQDAGLEVKRAQHDPRSHQRRLSPWEGCSRA